MSEKVKEQVKEAATVAAAMVITTAEFDQRLAQFVKVTAHSMELCRGLANCALRHFREHGDTSKLQALLEAMETSGRNYVRIAAFKLWLKAHAPITMEGKKFLKLKDQDFDDALLETAYSIPFWDFAPPVENVSWGADDVVVSMRNAIKRFEKENATPKDEAAKKKLAQAKEYVAKLA